MSTRAVYAGSFDPVTRGHIAVAEIAARMFDEVVMLIAANTGKSALFTVPERIALAEAALDEVVTDPALRRLIRLDSTERAVARYAIENGQTILVRGVRPVSDFDGEFSLAALNKQIAPALHTIFVPPPPALLFGSSSAAKELVRLGEDADWLVTEGVKAALRQRLVR